MRDRRCCLSCNQLAVALPLLALLLALTLPLLALLDNDLAENFTSDFR
jgi:hypothetical protein